jgi:hypothetical protein
LFPPDATGVLDNDANTSFIIYWWLGAGSTFTSGTLNTTWGTQVSANRAVGQTNVASATTGEWYITGVQLEANYQPTPFEHRPYGVELALCQRYYWRYYGVSGGYSRFPSTGTSYSATSWQGVLDFPMTMRTAPSVIESSGIGCTDNVSFDSTAFSSVTISTANSHPNGALIQGTGATGISNGSGHILMGRGGVTAYIALGAEL